MQAGSLTLTPEFVVLLLTNAAIAAASWANLRGEVRGVKRDIARIEKAREDDAPDIKVVPVLTERMDGLCDRLDATNDKVAEISSRVHQHRNWITALGLKLGLQFEERPRG